MQIDWVNEVIVLSIFSRKAFYSRIFLFFIRKSNTYYLWWVLILIIFFQALDWLFTCLFCWSSSTGRYFIRLCNRLHTPQCLFGIPIMEILPRCKQLHIKKIISIHTGTLTLAYDSNVYQSKGAQRNTYWIKLKVIMIMQKVCIYFQKPCQSVLASESLGSGRTSINRIPFFSIGVPLPLPKTGSFYKWFF